MERSFTNRALGVGGDSNTTSVTVRLPQAVVEYIDSHLNGQIKNRSEFLQHWAQVGVRVSMSEELSEALDWALGQEEEGYPAERWEDFYGTVTITPESLGVDAVEVVRYEVPQLTAEDLETAVAIPSDAVIVLTENGGAVYPDELTAIHETQLEALRNRVR